MNLLRIAVLTKDEDVFKKGEILFADDWKPAAFGEIEPYYFRRSIKDRAKANSGRWLHIQEYATTVIDLDNCKGDATLSMFIDSVIRYRREDNTFGYGIICKRKRYKTGGLGWHEDDVIDDNLNYLINLYRHGQAKPDTITVPPELLQNTLSREEAVKIYEWLGKELGE